MWKCVEPRGPTCYIRWICPLKSLTGVTSSSMILLILLVLNADTRVGRQPDNQATPCPRRMSGPTPDRSPRASHARRLEYTQRAVNMRKSTWLHMAVCGCTRSKGGRAHGAGQSASPLSTLAVQEETPFISVGANHLRRTSGVCARARRREVTPNWAFRPPPAFQPIEPSPGTGVGLRGEPAHPVASEACVRARVGVRCAGACAVRARVRWGIGERGG